MKRSHIMCTSRILTDLYFIKQERKTKDTLSKFVCSVLVVQTYWMNIKKFVWAIVAYNL